jgi:hypothetical protein
MALDGLPERLTDGEQIHAVHVAAGDSVGAAPLIEVLHRGGPGDRGSHAVAVVLDDEDDRESPQRAHVEGFVERPLVDRAVAEEAERDLVRLAHADRVAHARRDRQVPADDAVSAEVAGRDVVEVHAPALAAADAVDLAAQLGHERSRVGAAGESISVVTVGGDEVVVGPQQAHRPHRHRLLPDVQVEKAADLALHVELGTPLLEPPDEEHGPVLRERFVLLHCWFHLPSRRTTGETPMFTGDTPCRQRRGGSLK